MKQRNKNTTDRQTDRGGGERKRERERERGGGVDREQFKEGDEEVDRGNDGKTTSKSGPALNGIYYYGKPRTARSGGSWL